MCTYKSRNPIKPSNTWNETLTNPIILPIYYLSNSLLRFKGIKA